MGNATEADPLRPNQLRRYWNNTKKRWIFYLVVREHLDDGKNRLRFIYLRESNDDGKMLLAAAGRTPPKGEVVVQNFNTITKPMSDTIRAWGNDNK